jgi:hypothetical protein
MGQTLAPRIQVRQVVLGAAGKLSAGTITPADTPTIPGSIMASDVYNAAAYTYTDRASGGIGYPVAAAQDRHFPGSYVKDAVFAAGTYIITFYCD